MKEPKPIKAYIAGLRDAYEYSVDRLKQAQFWETSEEAERVMQASPWANDLVLYEVTVTPIKLKK